MPPKIIWTFWDQPERPFLVDRCIKSWRQYNPEWELRLLDRDTALRLVDMTAFQDRPDIPLQMFTDILRLKLLLKYGGVWVDATLFCTQALDQWLPNYYENDFFAFSCQRPDRLMTLWFLAGTTNNPLFATWAEAVFSFWESHRFRPYSYCGKQLIRKLMSLRKRNMISNTFWFSELMLNKIRLHPYPINMYIFEHVLQQHPSLQNDWCQRATLYDKPAEALQMHYKMNAALNSESKAFIDQAHTPVHKLNWRQDLGLATPGSNFEYLLQRHLPKHALDEQDFDE